MDNYTILFDDIKNNNYTHFEQTIDQFTIDINPGNLFDDNGNTLLIVSCGYNAIGFVIKLLNTYGKLCNVDHENKNKVYALSYTISNNNLFLTNKLLPLCSSKVVNESFIFALSKGNLVIINGMIDSGFVDLDYITSNGNSFLIYATAYNLPSIVLKLCHMSNVDVDQKNSKGQSALSRAIDKNFPQEVITCLLNKKTSVCDRHDSTGLIGSTLFRRYNISEFRNVENVIAASGGYGEVQSVIQISSNKTKILKRYRGYSSERFLDGDIIKEITFLNRLSLNYSCNVVELNGYILNTHFYLVLHPLDLTLKEYFKIISPLPLFTDYFLTIIQSAVKELYKTHSLGISHNDIKSPNILITNNSAYFIDYGLANYNGFSGSRKMDKEYITTAHVTAPEGGDFYFIDSFNQVIYRKEDHFSYRKSYKADVYSLGVTICNLIFNNYDSYISINGNIYTSSDVKITINRKYRILNEKEVALILVHGSEFYVMIIDMININPFERISVKEILGITSPEVMSNEISFYVHIFINAIQQKISSSMYHYTPEEIKKSLYELNYREEIYQSYKNDTITVYPCGSFHDYYSKIFFFLNGLKSELSFDTICSTIIFLNKELKFSDTYEHFASYFYPVFHYYSGIYQEIFYPAKAFGASVNDSLRVSNILNGRLEQFSFTPITIFIEYLVIELQINNFSTEHIAKMEWFIMKNILIYLLSSSSMKTVVVQELCLYFCLGYFNENSLILPESIANLMTLSDDIARFNIDIPFSSSYL